MHQVCHLLLLFPADTSETFDDAVMISARLFPGHLELERDFGNFDLQTDDGPLQELDVFFGGVFDFPNLFFCLLFIGLELGKEGC